MREMERSDLAKQLLSQQSRTNSIKPNALEIKRDNLEKIRDDYRAEQREKSAPVKEYHPISQEYAKGFTSDSLQQKAGPEAVWAVGEYVDTMHRYMNCELRGEPYPHQENFDAREAIGYLTKAIDTNPLPHDARVYRLAKEPEFGMIFGEKAQETLSSLLKDDKALSEHGDAFLDGLQKGKPFTYQQFLSTGRSKEPEQESKYLSDRQVILTLNLNKGTPALPVENMNVTHPFEHEVIVQRDTSFVFEEAHFEKDKKGRNVICLTLSTPER